MELLTKAIQEKAQAQYPMGSSMDQLIVAKFFDPQGSWSLMNSDPDDPDYCWGIVDGFEVEMGSFSLSEFESFRGRFGLPLERDLHFKPITARELWEKLNKGVHV